VGEVRSGGSGAAVNEETVAGLPPATELSTAIGEGSKLGRYVVLETIGSGAMGRVVRAYDPMLRREVALKLVKTPRGNARARILREAQAMARLSHPNVVPVYDVGEHEREVFVAMELIEGQTLRGWLDTPRYWREVLDVMLQAGRGLAAAHDVGLVHRDFKPANVLIADVGPEAHRVRVVDFGLARVVHGTEPRPLERSAEIPRDPDEPLDPTVTEAGVAIGTPAYMAPEQPEGAAADERSDQFGFCAALFEGLYGTRPFVAPDARALYLAKRRRPVIPSGNVPRRIAAVVARGLSPEPVDRFGSMNELLAALEADPVRRFRRVLYGAGAMIVGGGIAYAVAGRDSPCAAARERVEPIWNPARSAEIGAAFEATGVLYAARSWEKTAAGLQTYTEAWVAQHTDACEATRVRGEQSAELMDARMACLAGRRRELEAHVDALSSPDARTVEGAVKAVAGLPDVERCADPDYVLAAVAPPDDPELAASVAALRADLARSRAQMVAGHYQEGTRLAREVLAAAETLPYAPLHAEAQLRLGSALMRTSAYEDAAEQLEAAFYACRRVGLDEEAALAASELVFLHGVDLADPVRAEAWTKRAWAEVDRFGTDVMRAALLDKEAVVLAHAGREGSLPLVERALELKRKHLAPDHPFIAGSLTNLGNLRFGLGQHAAAVPAYEEALRIMESTHGADHPTVGLILTNLGNTHQVLGHTDLAFDCIMRGLAVREAALGPDHPEVALTLAALSHVHEDRGDREAAVAAGRRALAIYERTVGDEHIWASTLLHELAGIERRSGDLESAREHLERAVAAMDATKAEDDPSLVAARLALGNVLADLGRTEESTALLQHALEHVREDQRASPDVVEARERLRASR
jgi:tetratricopeptide (TPR) repeat protein